MSITVYLVGHKLETLDHDDRPLGRLIDDARMHWNEDTSPQCLVFVTDQGDVLASAMRDNADPELCHTMYMNGAIETHRCHYVLDANGEWLHTEVTIEPRVELEVSFDGYRPGGNGKGSQP